MLNISIVLYHPKWEEEVLPLVREVLRVKNLRAIYLLDNSEEATGEAVSQLPVKDNQLSKIHYLFNGANLGYGKAHNIALRESAFERTPVHLVMNSDIRVAAGDIDAMYDFMMAHPPVGQLMPRVVGLNSQQQFLAKRLPSPLDVSSAI